MTTRTIPTPCPACHGSGKRVCVLPLPYTGSRLLSRREGESWVWLRCLQCRGDGHADAPEQPASEWMVPRSGHPGVVGGVLEVAGEVGP